jgi:hypothetical protein
MDKISEAIETANDRLKVANTGITIFRRGSKLSLRGVLPPKPGRTKKTQQTIALDIFANPAGIKRAEKEALKLGGLLATKEFDWSYYLINHQTVDLVAIQETVAKFKEDYFNRRELTPESKTTWNDDYQSVFNKFPEIGKLNAEVLLKTVLATRPDSRSRRRACLATKAIAHFASIDFDPLPYVGNYSPKVVQPRDLPSDEEINDFYYQISNPAWRFAYGLQAAYGLRNYEIFTSDLTSLRQAPGHLLVKDGISGDRVVWCLYPEWWKDWELGRGDRVLPSITGKNNSDLGNRVSRAYPRYGWNKPYILRHCWAVRALTFNLPVEMAAKMMDHSVKVHVETYQKWITEEHNNRLYQLLIERLDRPFLSNK